MTPPCPTLRSSDLHGPRADGERVGSRAVVDRLEAYPDDPAALRGHAGRRLRPARHGRPQARHRPRRGTHPARRRILLLQGTAGPGGAERFHREVAAQPPLLPRRARRRLARGACARAGGDDGTQSYGAEATLRLPAPPRLEERREGTEVVRKVGSRGLPEY